MRKLSKITITSNRAQPNRPISIVKPHIPQQKIIQTNDLANVSLNKMTNFSVKNSNRVFIIGGGPSIKNMDLSFLDGEDTICVNKSIDLIKNPTFFITMDYTFFRKIGATIQNVISKAKSSHFIVNRCHSYIQEMGGTYVDIKSNIKYIGLEHFTSVIESKYDIHNKTGFGLSINEFCHGNNSGYCAIQFAILAGYEEIYLLGFDLGSIKNHAETHFHNSYPNVNFDAFRQKLNEYSRNLITSISKLSPHSTIKIMTMTPTPLEGVIPLVESVKNLNRHNSQEILSQPINMSSLTNLIIVAYYTINTPYENEAKKLINSLNKLGLTYDVVGVNNLGNWQANTRFKAKFMEDMLNKHPGKNLLYVDSDAIVHSKPILFENYNYDIAVRWQDFRWRKNECLSGTIFMANNEKTRELCKRWQSINISEGPNANTFEQWNLGTVIKQMEGEGKLITNNLPPEYTFIFDSMRALYPNANPVIEHFQASRKLKNKI